VNCNAKPMFPENTLIVAQLSLVEMCMHMSILRYVCFNIKNKYKNLNPLTGSGAYNTIFKGSKSFILSLRVTFVTDKQPKTRKTFTHYGVNVNRNSFNKKCKKIYLTLIFRGWAE
jgi:hypothetical protein